MTAPITAARTGGLSFRIGSIPVTLHVSFLLVIGLLGFGVGGVDRLAVWVAVATVAVLLHELGHAVVGRMAGLRPRIDLAGFGGVTSWTDGGRRTRLGRGWSLAISLAGPGVGFLGGAVALLFGASSTLSASGGLADFALAVWLFASFGWGILNLLPILPLDGGQALREVLPGTPRQRMRRAAIVGVVVGGCLVLWAIVAEQLFLAIVAGYITWSNVQAAQAGPAQERDEDLVGQLRAASEQGDATRVAELSAEAVRTTTRPRLRAFAIGMLVRALVAEERWEEAYRVIVDPRRDVDLPPDLVGAAIAGHPDKAAIDTVVRTWASRDPSPQELGVIATVLSGHRHHEEVATLLHQRLREDEPVVPPVVAADVQLGAHVDGDPRTAAQLGWDLMTRGGIRSPLLAINTARSLAQVGRLDDAVAALSAALTLGVVDTAPFRDDEDLTPLHDHPDWPRLLRGEPVSDPAAGAAS